MDRDLLQTLMVEEIVSGLDTRSLTELATTALQAQYDNYTDDELRGEVLYYYPHLLDDEEEEVA